jgi:hypothetical protein
VTVPLLKERGQVDSSACRLMIFAPALQLPSSGNPINREMVYPGGNRPRSFRTWYRLFCAKFG